LLIAENFKISRKAQKLPIFLEFNNLLSFMLHMLIITIISENYSFEKRVTSQFQIKEDFIFGQIFQLKSEGFSEALEFIRYLIPKTSIRRTLGLNNLV
jgi:hypothetical protein